MPSIEASMSSANPKDWQEKRVSSFVAILVNFLFYLFLKRDGFVIDV